MKNSTAKIGTSGKGRSLSESNVHLRSENARSLRIRSVASSTAIETGETIKSIEAKLRKGNFSKHRLTLA